MTDDRRDPPISAAEPTTPSGLRPAVGWLVALLLVHLLLAGFPPALATPLRSTVLLVGVAALQHASRAWCGTREFFLAALACGAAAGALLHDLNASTGAMAITMRVLSLVATAAWAVFWLRCGRR